MKCKVCFDARPHPDLLPRGEGTAGARPTFYGRASRKSRRVKLQYGSERFSLSLEEGAGAVSRCARFLPGLHFFLYYGRTPGLSLLIHHERNTLQNGLHSLGG